MKLLIYGAGVIGCHYAAQLSKAGHDVSVLARGKRLKEFRQNGLRCHTGGTVHTANVTVIEKPASTDGYDFIFLTVRQEQLRECLRQLHDINSPTIVTMVNTIEPYEDLETLCGKGRLLPAFPSAGGSFKNGILDARFTPALIQPTTFGEIDGTDSPRVKALGTMLRQAGISCQAVRDMHVWQICHLAMVVPLADAYYATSQPRSVSKDRAVMHKTAQELKKNFLALHKSGHKISPVKLNFFRLCPLAFLRWLLPLVYQSDFADIFMYQHSIHAAAEMRSLHNQLYGYLEENGCGR